MCNFLEMGRRQTVIREWALFPVKNWSQNWNFLAIFMIDQIVILMQIPWDICTWLVEQGFYVNMSRLEQLEVFFKQLNRWENFKKSEKFNKCLPLTILKIQYFFFFLHEN